MKISLLLLEDDKLFGETLCDVLEEEGFSITHVTQASHAYEKLYTTHYSCMLVDIGLPDESGISFISRLRHSGNDTPIIVLTSYPDKAKEAFNVLADDYVRKNGDIEELILRIRALLRRRLGTSLMKVDLGEGYIFDVTHKLLFHEEIAINLTPKELELLALFIRFRTQVISTEQIYDELWSSSEMHSSGSLRVYIASLKKYFGERIHNIRGIGYRFE